MKIHEKKVGIARDIDGYIHVGVGRVIEF